MKRIYLAIMMLATITLSSCSNFLDITPVGKVRPTKVSDYRALLTKGYSMYSNTYSLSSYRSDEYKFLGGNYGGKYIEHFFWNENNDDFDTSLYSYLDLYQIIFICNQVISAQGDMTSGTKEIEEQLVAEAYALRAFVYFELVSIYADVYDKSDAETKLAVPINLEPEIDLNATIDKSSIQDVYNQILSDLKLASELAKVDIETDNTMSYRFSKVAIQALNANVNLSMGNWKDVILSSNKVLEINSSLQNINNLKDDFLTYRSVENIFALRRVVTTSDQRSTFVMSTSLSSLLDDEGNLRKSVIFDEDGKSIIYKDNDYKVGIRVPEVLLMLAEASLRLDTPDAATAKTQLKKLVEARYTTDAATKLKGSIDAMDNAQLLKEVLRQRRMELAFQGKRWSDLKRLGKPSIVHEYGTGDSKRVETLQENDSRYVIKFPTEAVRLNPNLLK